MTDSGFSDVIAYLRLRAEHEHAQAKVLVETGHLDDAQKCVDWAARLNSAARALESGAK